MLITPMTPKVIASPAAASSSTEPRRQAVVNALRDAPELQAQIDRADRRLGGRGDGGRLAGQSREHAASCRCRRERASTATAVSRSASLASGDDSSAAARACSIRCFDALDRFPSRWRGRAPAGRPDRASGTPPRPRRAGSTASGENSRRLPSAASMAPRTALFMRTGCSPLAITSGAAAPVAASVKAAVVLFDEQRLVRAA